MRNPGAGMFSSLLSLLVTLGPLASVTTGAFPSLVTGGIVTGSRGLAAPGTLLRHYTRNAGTVEDVAEDATVSGESRIRSPLQRERQQHQEDFGALPSDAARNTPDAGYKLTEEVQRPVTRPADVTPCVVPLIQEQNFSSYPGKVPVTFAPPSAKACGATWQLVVVTVSAHVSGRQYDRVLEVELGALPLLLTTTAEPVRRPGVKFRLEKNITQLTPFLQSAHNGTVTLGNLVNSIYTGIYYVTIELLFFRGDPPAGLPDVVLPLPNPAIRTPHNVVAAKLDIYAAQFGADEFYYANVPTSYYDALTPDQQQGQSNGSSFREVIAYLDGMPVGAVFPQPLIYSGGIDPVFWAPFMGIGSLFVPTYTLDITPFVGVLLYGGFHNISMAVTYEPPGATWLTYGALLLWTDPGQRKTGGSTTLANFSDLQYTVDINPPASADTTISVSASRQYEFVGFVSSSAGNVTTRVTSALTFSNSNTLSRDLLTQSVSFLSRTEGQVKSFREEDGETVSETEESTEYPLSLLFDVVNFPDLSYTLYSRVSHGAFTSSLSLNAFEQLQNSQDVSSYRGSNNQSTVVESGTQLYNYTSSVNGCYLRQVASSYFPGAGFNVTFDNTNTTSC